MKYPLGMPHVPGPADVARRAAVQPILRDLLLKGGASLMRRVWHLPESDPLRLRVEREELTIVLQSRAPHPDTMLSRRLSAFIDTALERFSAHSGLASACKSAYDAATKANETREADLPRVVEYEASYRLIYALKLAADLLLQVGAATLGIRLHIKAMELLAILDPEHQELEALDPLRAYLQATPAMGQIEQITECCAVGYHLLPRASAKEVCFAANDSGALAAVWLDGTRMDVDLSLFVKSADDLPDIHQQASVVAGVNPDAPNFIYIDRLGRERELTYSSVQDRYRFE